MKEQLTSNGTPTGVDIFLRETDGNFKWIAMADTVALARQKIVQNPAASESHVSDYRFGHGRKDDYRAVAETAGTSFLLNSGGFHCP